ncbi:molecular chaperone HtpG [Vigna unguiculata]|uniref:Molecular chaperone HtpG n=1 Tax=Vigna unguiculata TaxID=3917 RepID=A0A4D6LWH8_VIGUN|nr:molecular chaperone HtpG [Vigna unguiculata]
MTNDKILVLAGEKSEMLSLVKKTFYSNKGIFLRELIINASNALDEIQFERLTKKNILNNDELIVRLILHKVNKTLSIIDNGIGITKVDLVDNLGVGFYSTYLVAHKVILTSKHNDDDQYIWDSQPGSSFFLTKDIDDQRLPRGTKITLFLKDDQLEYLEETTIKNLISKDCQQITHPIYLWSENTKDHWKLINNWLHDQEMRNKFVAQNLGKHLPDHLEFNVLFKLSLKSLKRFGCIRKSWALLLENPNFTNLLRFNLIWNQNSCFDDTSLLLCLGPVNNQIIQSTGIVYLWNPSTNECKVTPPSPTEDIPYYVDIMIKYEGFGYDWARDDYKVIRNVILTSKHNDDDQYIWDSQPGSSFFLTKDIDDQRLPRGTKITLFLKDDQLEYLEETTIKNLICKDCQQITHPIYLWSENTKDHWKLINNWLHDQEMRNKFVAQNLGKHLPDHLEFNVLFKLSLKSLKRFGCIRKSWALLLENPNFTNLLRFNLIWNQNSCFDDTSLLLCLGPVNNQIIQSTGIVYLWNPSTNECKVTPPSPTEDIPYYVDIMIKYEGFGYDWARDDYKVIRNVCYFEDGHLDGINYGEWDLRDLWEIYSLRSNSWRKLNIELLNCQAGEDVIFDNDVCREVGLLFYNKEMMIKDFIENRTKATQNMQNPKIESKRKASPGGCSSPPGSS